MVLRVDVKEAPTMVRFPTGFSTGISLERMMLAALLLSEGFTPAGATPPWEGGDEPYHDSYEGLPEDPDEDPE
jgi:hypothetical protein